MFYLLLAAAVADVPAPALPDVTQKPAIVAGVDISDETFNDQMYRLCGGDMQCQGMHRTGRDNFLRFYPLAAVKDRGLMDKELAASVMPNGFVNWARADSMLGLRDALQPAVTPSPSSFRSRGRRGVYCTSRVSKSGRKASVYCY